MPSPSPPTPLNPLCWTLRPPPPPPPSPSEPASTSPAPRVRPAPLPHQVTRHLTNCLSLTHPSHTHPSTALVSYKLKLNMTKAKKAKAPPPSAASASEPRTAPTGSVTSSSTSSPEKASSSSSSFHPFFTQGTSAASNDPLANIDTSFESLTHGQLAITEGFDLSLPSYEPVSTRKTTGSGHCLRLQCAFAAAGCREKVTDDRPSLGCSRLSLKAMIIYGASEGKVGP